MGALADLLNSYAADEAQHTPTRHVDDTDGRKLTANIEGDHNAGDHPTLLTTLGHNPDKVEFVDPPAIYTRWKPDGTKSSTYRYKLRSKCRVDSLVDQVASAPKHVPVGVAGRGVFVFQASDLQLGKIDGDGVQGTVARYMASVDRALSACTTTMTREPITAIHLVFAGDCIENGGVSQGGKLAWRQSLTVTEQVRLWRRLLLHTVKVFAPLTDELQVTVVGGNHDDATRLPVQTRADDNWATEGAIAVADALAENPGAFGHVRVQVPPVDQGYVTVRVADSVFTVAHGHQWRKGKEKDWWASQAFYQGNPSGAHFLLHGHWHSLNVSQDGPRTVVCSPTFDGGSAWFRDLTGAESRQGGLVYVTNGAEFSGLTLI